VWASPRASEGQGALAVLAATGGTVVVASFAGRLDLVDAGTGEACRSLSLGGHLPAVLALFEPTPAIAIDGPHLYLVVSRRTGTALHHVVTAVDLARGAVEWESAPLPYPDERRDPMHPLFLDANAVYACSADGTVRAFDRRDGAIAWQWGLGSCELAPLPPELDGTRAFVARHGEQWSLFSRAGAAPPPLEHATIQGRMTLLGTPRAGVPIVVHDHVAVTDATGHFTATVDARGSVAVSTAERDGLTGGAATVTLDGRGRYEVALDLVPPPPLD
jgi:putative pyrroloquinoline-quinone binding quinoprotein